ncbi:MAG: hypothetical protein ACK55Z_09290, partial [bacterium]
MTRQARGVIRHAHVGTKSWCQPPITLECGLNAGGDGTKTRRHGPSRGHRGLSARPQLSRLGAQSARGPAGPAGCPDGGTAPAAHRG